MLLTGEAHEADARACGIGALDALPGAADERPEQAAEERVLARLHDRNVHEYLLEYEEKNVMHKCGTL